MSLKIFAFKDILSKLHMIFSRLWTYYSITEHNKLIWIKIEN